MHVLYIMGQSTGGLPHYTAELANAVSAHADVTVLKPTTTSADDLFDDDVDVIEAFAPLGVSMPEIYRFEVSPTRLLRGILSYNQLKDIGLLDPDVIHDATGLFPQVKLFSKLHGIDTGQPFVVTFHEVPMDRFSLSRPPILVEELVDAAIPALEIDRSVVHTANQKRALIKRGTPEEEIDVIPHGAYSIFGEHTDVDVDTEPNTLLFFGNVVPPKGIDTLVEAIPLVEREIPDVTLIIAGSGKVPKRSKQIITEHRENFEIHNYFIPNDQVGAFFSRAEVVTLPYRDQDGTKGHSGALSAAYSFGKPIVASTAGEFEDLVERSGCGRTVPPEDPKRLARAIVSVLSSEDQKAKMRENSLQMAERLSWDTIAKQYIDVYRRVHEPYLSPMTR